MYVSCKMCGKDRWARTQDVSNGKSLVCRSCGFPSTPTYNRKQQELHTLGAKRASELGKPVFKNRDPWYLPHKCSSCGKDTWHQRKDLHRVCKACAYVVRKTAHGEDHVNWKGGRYHHGDGYIVVQLLPDGPYSSMAQGRGYVLEHRLIMAEHIGRCLSEGEVVHHINGDKQDNRIENLELLPDKVSHLPYNNLQKRITKLEEKVREQNSMIWLLLWHIRELEYGNPELATGLSQRASVEALQEAHPSNSDGEEKVHPCRKL